MSVRTAERRRAGRSSSAFVAVLHDRRGQVVGRGRTVNISERGAMVVCRACRDRPRADEALLQLTVPAVGVSRRTGRRSTRMVLYRCRVVRAERVGHLLGLAVEFIEKLE